ncbi:MAG: hypothetical protein EOP56_03210 [Sphingobacteriales bacterium]|nr:MAG: hypothetical protein EOP56_03210 [Sphingobacteriales bacterium]
MRNIKAMLIWMYSMVSGISPDTFLIGTVYAKRRCAKSLIPCLLLIFTQTLHAMTNTILRFFLRNGSCYIQCGDDMRLADVFFSNTASAYRQRKSYATATQQPPKSSTRAAAQQLYSTVRRHHTNINETSKGY